MKEISPMIDWDKKKSIELNVEQGMCLSREC